MKEPEELTGKANDEVMNNMRWELSLVGLNTGVINQQVDAFIEYTYHLQTKGWGSVRVEVIDDDQIEDTQRDTHVHAGTCCLGTPALASSKTEVVSRERKRTPNVRRGKHEQMKPTKKTTKQSRRKTSSMRRRAPQQPLYWQSTYHSSTILRINLSAMATLLLLNALFQRYVLTVCRVVTEQGGGWDPFCDGKWRVENDRIS
jgi:hypothetical protein